MDRYTELSLTAQTAYAQMFDAALNVSLQRDVRHLTGSFAKKTVKGRTYWYFQYTGILGKLHQIYVGPANEIVLGIIERFQSGAPRRALEPLARSSEALGLMPTHGRHYRVLRRLDEYGFFGAGGVLIGTHAFLAYGNMLGLRWSTSPRTEDLDSAHAARNLSLALPANIEIDTHAAIESLSMGFLPPRALAGGAGPGYIDPREPGFRLDFLTPLHRGPGEPFEHPSLNLMLQPLKFLEFLLIDVTQAVVFSPKGATVVNVPAPARYALHKLVVYAERPLSRRTKAEKDLHQAAALLAFLRTERPEAVASVWDDLLGRGKGWRKRAAIGLNAIQRAAPELGVTDWLSALEQ